IPSLVITCKAVLEHMCDNILTTYVYTNTVFKHSLPVNLYSLVRPTISMTASDSCSPAVFTTCYCVAWRISIRSRTEARSDCKDGAALINRLEYGCCGSCKISKAGPDSTT